MNDCLDVKEMSLVRLIIKISCMISKYETL